MTLLLALARRIDKFTTWVGRSVAWLVVAAALISAGNAVIRKLFDTSSNAWLELQWWLFALVFLLAAPWTLARNEHIRIDVVSNLLAAKTRDWIDILGHVFFLLPTAAMLFVTSSHYFWTSFLQNEQSVNAGGLPQWPIKALIPAAFALLFIQGISELIKRVAVMRGDLDAGHRPGTGGGYHDVATGRSTGQRANETGSPSVTNQNQD